ncbi:MAG: TerB family tellurite resistance protein [Bacteroidota bacterium]
MSILVGRVIIKENDKSGEVLPDTCPVCGDDMFLKNFEEFITVFNKPLFRIKVLDTFYQCEACGSSYNTTLKELVKLDGQKKEIKFQEAGKLYAKALIAAMTYMAIIDGELDEHEQRSLHAIIGKYSNIADELIETMDYVKRNGNKDEYVYHLLQKVHKVLSTESVLVLLAEAVQMLMADGKMKKEERLLINTFLITSGLPKELYKTLIEKIKKLLKKK